MKPCQRRKNRKPDSNRGQSTVMDLLMLSMIVVIASAFLHIYYITHSSTNIKNLKDRMTREYAEKTLLSLSYLQAHGTGYTTTQEDSLINTSDKTLNPLYRTSNSLKEKTKKLDSLLENLSINSEQDFNEMRDVLEEERQELSQIKTELSEEKQAICSTPEKLEADCETITETSEIYETLIGTSNQINPSEACTKIKDGCTEALNTLSELELLLTEADEKLYKAEEDLAAGGQRIQDIIQDIRCLLREIDVKNDKYISYAKTGVKPGATLLDLLPAPAHTETKTVSEMLGEALYIEDRLIQSNILKTFMAAGMRLTLTSNKINPDNPGERIIQADILTLNRKDYRETAAKTVKEALDKILKKQGYTYCFKAADCCTTIKTGECDNIPTDAVKTVKTFQTLDNKTAEATLHIWRT